ncbi:hypothetical protein OH805_01400 [Streptomyces sp. NBC_00879]|uniref:hypothetical protein n=1 Tax=Streptomyces sp. NBC_00879 TaxID=2975855 RepID=UPI003862FB83|nr:hypothetical protein OH805_01400 [Streptomyces sp. NBC_00879]
MPHIRHRGTTAPQQTQGEFTKGGWILIGAVTMAVGALFHAVTGLLRIVRDMIAEPRDGREPSESPPVAAESRPHELAGWVLIAGVTVAVGALSHAVANLAQVVREILRGQPMRSS